MDFNVDKSKVMHFGEKDTNYEYIMFGKPLTEVQDEKDLVVINRNDLKYAMNAYLHMINQTEC